MSNIEAENIEIEEVPEETPIIAWEEKQRDLVTSVVDYNLLTLHDLIQEGNINLSPDYQRRSRWDEARRSALIESFLMNVPVPPIFLNENQDQYGSYSVIDGRQRLETIKLFLSNELKLSNLQIFREINGKRFEDLPHKLQSILKTRVNLRAVIILAQSDPDIKYEVFRRLNTGGVKLNNQEIRNSVYAGPFNTLLVKLSEMSLFHELLGIGNPKNSSLYQEMGDVELVLRFLAFHEDWQTFEVGVTHQMDKFMEAKRHLTEDESKTYRERFLSTLEKVEICFGKPAFRRWLPQQQKWRNQLLLAAYDVQMLGLYPYKKEHIQAQAAQIRAAYQHLFEDERFQDALRSNVPDYFRLRVRLFQDAVKRLLDA
jgi:hypothetical protein